MLSFFVIFLVIGNYVFASENPTNEANMSMGFLCQKDNIINTIPEVYDPINSKYGIDVSEYAIENPESESKSESLPLLGQTFRLFRFPPIN